MAGILTGSLALLADAGHMLTDVAGLVLALAAMKFAERPPSPRRTYGYHRVEILAAVTNGVVLLGVAGFLLREAWQRLHAPRPVATTEVLVVAFVGLLVNAVSAVLLHSGARGSLNVRGAYNEVLADAVSSVGVIAGAVVMKATGWYCVDPIVAAAIALFVLPRTFSLLREALQVLLEGAPRDVDIAAVRLAMESVAGVRKVHDLHVWTLTSGVHALSAHAVLADGAAHGEVLERAARAGDARVPDQPRHRAARGALLRGTRPCLKRAKARFKPSRQPKGVRGRSPPASKKEAGQSPHQYPPRCRMT